MTRQQQEKILNRIAEVDNDISALRRVRMEIGASGYSSASLSSGGGSKSYTRANIAEITTLIRELTAELVELRSMLGGGGRIRQIIFTRC